MCSGCVPRLSSHFLAETTASPLPSEGERAPQLAPAGGLLSAGTGPRGQGIREGRRTLKNTKGQQGSSLSASAD